MKNLCLTDAWCQILQAKALLNLWLDNQEKDSEIADLIGALLTLLHGVPESVDDAGCEISKLRIQLKDNHNPTKNKG